MLYQAMYNKQALGNSWRKSTDRNVLYHIEVDAVIEAHLLTLSLRPHSNESVWYQVIMMTADLCVTEWPEQKTRITNGTDHQSRTKMALVLQPWLHHHTWGILVYCDMHEYQLISIRNRKTITTKLRTYVGDVGYSTNTTFPNVIPNAYACFVQS